MSAMIEVNDFMFSVREMPWHGLGTVIQEAPTSADALRIARLDWKVIQEKIFTEDKLIDGFVANVRSDTRDILGIVTPRYKVVQNDEAFAFIDSLLGEGVTYETAGSLENGKRVWMLAKMDGIDILDDKIIPYMVFTHGHDRLNAIKACMTPTRVVCNNTLNLALNTAVRSWSTAHVGDIRSKISEAQRTLGLAKDYMINLKGEAERLENIKMTDNDVKDFINDLFPVMEDSTPREESNIVLVRNSLYNAYRNTPDIQKFRGSAWGVINAVSDLVGHAEPLRRTSTYKERRFLKIVDGSPIMDRAVELLAA